MNGRALSPDVLPWLPDVQLRRTRPGSVDWKLRAWIEPQTLPSSGHLAERFRSLAQGMSRRIAGNSKSRRAMSRRWMKHGKPNRGRVGGRCWGVVLRGISALPLAADAEDGRRDAFKENVFIVEF